MEIDVNDDFVYQILCKKTVLFPKDSAFFCRSFSRIIRHTHLSKACHDEQTDIQGFPYYIVHAK